MKLWLISQSVNRNYDTYDSAVVAAETEEAARLTHPHDIQGVFSPKRAFRLHLWAAPQDVTVEFLAEYNGDAGVICASFNAG